MGGIDGVAVFAVDVDRIVVVGVCVVNIVEADVFGIIDDTVEVVCDVWNTLIEVGVIIGIINLTQSCKILILYLSKIIWK